MNHSGLAAIFGLRWEQSIQSFRQSLQHHAAAQNPCLLIKARLTCLRIGIQRFVDRPQHCLTGCLIIFGGIVHDASPSSSLISCLIRWITRAFANCTAAGVMFKRIATDAGDSPSTAVFQNANHVDS